MSSGHPEAAPRTATEIRRVKARLKARGVSRVGGNDIPPC